MKKLVKLAAAAAVVISMNAGVALAQSACSITTTGQNSNNTCTVSGENRVTVVCVNGVQATNVNSQSAVSGSVNVSGNTVSGTATSGDATNVNAVANELAQGCATAAPVTAAPVAANTPAAPTTPATTTSPAAAATPQAPATPAPVTIKALPKTGNDSTYTTLAVSAVSLAMVAAAAQFAVKLYRTRSLN